jgi:beta-galactosidase
VDWTMTELSEPAKVTLSVQLEGDEYALANHWEFWVFPTSRPGAGIAADEAIRARLGPHYAGLRPIAMGERKGLRLVSNLDPDTMDSLAGGGDALLLGSGPFPTLPTSFQMSQTGRVRGNLATIIADHPLMRRFPHDSYCDWQFYSMLEGASAVNFNELAVPFDPILEVASSFKLIFKQASLFEWRVGRGRLLVWTLNFDPSDAAAGYLLDSIVQYMQGAEFAPRTAVTPAQIERLIRSHS